MPRRTPIHRSVVSTALAAAALAGCASESTAPAEPGAALATASAAGPLAVWHRAAGPLFANSFAVLPDGALLAGSEEGLFRSADEGRSWTAVAGLPEGMAVTSLAAAPSGAVYAGSVSGGVFRSLDGGARWEHAGLPGAGVGAVGLDGEGRVYAGASGYEGGVFRSDDAGTSWMQVLPPLNRRDFIVTGLSFWKSDVYLTTHADDAWHAVNGGEVWSFLGGLYAVPEYLAPAHQITVLPTGTLVAGFSGGILRSVDGGASWKPALLGPGVQWVVRDGAGGAFAYAWGGTIYRSADDGASWAPVVRGRHGLYATAFGVTPGGALLLATAEGMYRTELRTAP